MDLVHCQKKYASLQRHLRDSEGIVWRDARPKMGHWGRSPLILTPSGAGARGRGREEAETLGTLADRASRQILRYCPKLAAGMPDVLKGKCLLL